MATPEFAWCPSVRPPFVPAAAEPFAFLRLSAQLRPVARPAAARIEVRMHSQPQP
jgi:hypothetical protein